MTYGNHKHDKATQYIAIISRVMTHHLNKYKKLHSEKSDHAPFISDSTVYVELPTMGYTIICNVVLNQV